MLTVDEIREAVTKIGEKYGIKSAYLFGSYAKNTATENSDVDLLVDKGDIHTFKEYFHFCDDLENELGKKIDVSSERGMYPQIFDFVKKDRILIYER